MLLGEVIHGDYNTWVGPTKGLLHSGTNYQVKYRSNTGQILVKYRSNTGQILVKYWSNTDQILVK